MPSDPSPPSRVWATLLTRPQYVPGLLTVHYTLKAVSAFPLVVMATETLPEASRKTIRAQGMLIVEVDHLVPAAGQHAGFDPSFSRFDDVWTKLRVFGLTQFDRVILIDSDMIFCRAMDELFDMELPGRDWIGAAPACICNPFKIAHYPSDWIPENCSISKQTSTIGLLDPQIPAPDAPRTAHLLNSGLVVLHPSTETMEYVEHFLNTSPTVATSRFADQDVITEAFKGRWRPLPWWANALKTERAVHPTVWKDTEVRLIHYILEKPWNERPAAAKQYTNVTAAKGKLPKQLLDLVASPDGTEEPQTLTNYDHVHTWWWIAYEALVADLKAGGDSTGWHNLEANVKR